MSSEKASGEYMNITLRPAVSEDALQIAEVFLTSRKVFLTYALSAHPDEGVRNYIKYLVSNSDVTVALVDEKISGFLAIAKHEKFGEIDQLYLHPNAVGFGIGSRLITHAKRILGSPIRLYTFQQNTGARRFYERHGFVAIQLTDGSTNEERCPDVLYEWNAEEAHLNES